MPTDNPLTIYPNRTRTPAHHTDHQPTLIIHNSINYLIQLHSDDKISHSESLH
jgi:hypothetical protein